MAKDKVVATLDDKSFWDHIQKNTNKIVDRKWKNRTKSKSKKK